MPDMKLPISEVLLKKESGTNIFADTGSVFYHYSQFNLCLSSLLAIPVNNMTGNYP